MLRLIFITILILFSAGCDRETISSVEDGATQGEIKSEKQAEELILGILKSKGKADFSIDNIQALGEIFVVKVSGPTGEGQYQNELIVRQDGAVMPVNGTLVNGKSGKTIVSSKEQAFSLSKAWLIQINSQQMQVGNVYPIEFAYVADIEFVVKPNERINQLIVRKDGPLLPVYNKPTSENKTVRAISPGGHSFGWVDPFFLPQFDIDWDIDWGSSMGDPDWGWGWGTGDSWTDQNDVPPDNGDCHPDMTPGQCECTKDCRARCPYNEADPDCFERCYDRCMLPVG